MFNARKAQPLESAKCEESPTGAHWRKCGIEMNAKLGHTHELQTCQYCNDVKVSPCWTCLHNEPKQ